MALYQLDDIVPEVAESAWIADSAEVIGRVALEDDVSVWFNAVIRGDNEPIHIGRGSNIQDGSVLHSDHGLPLTIGQHVTVGHQVILHGCTIGDETLIGMGAIVLNGAVIGAGSLIAAGALIPQGVVIPPRSLVAGVPGRVRRELSDAELAANRDNAVVYERLMALHRDAGT